MVFEEYRNIMMERALGKYSQGKGCWNDGQTSSDLSIGLMMSIKQSLCIQRK